ncbi:MAG: phenylalanine--tRNA ligase subunit alpha, partial [Bacteroidota bacterium]
MDQLLQQIEEYKKEIEAFQPANEQDVENFRIKFLGTKGIVKAIMGEMKNVPNERKKEAGQLLNEFKQFTEAKFEELKSQSINNGQPTTNIDFTLPGDPIPIGSRHPITLMRNRIISIYQRLGFAVAE